MITLYDIPSTLKGQAWSPNVWKIRFVLNYKRLEYQTEWVEYPDIAKVVIAAGGTATAKKKDGSPYYTLPMISDTSTGAVVTDSLKIAEYLDTTYPDTTRIVPPNSYGYQNGLMASWDQYFTSSWEPIIGKAFLILNPESQGFFRETRERVFGKTMEQLIQPDDKILEQLKSGFDRVAKWYRDDSSVFLGEELTYGDIQIAGDIIWMRKVLGEQIWQNMSTWNGGRWGKLLDFLGQYGDIYEP